MVIVQIIGGLGNQMFQYAYAKSLAKKKYEVKLDISAFETYTLHGGYQLDSYAIDLKHATEEDIRYFQKDQWLTKIQNKLNIPNKKLVNEKKLFFNENFLNLCDNKYIYGYFQSEKYFMSIREILLESFVIQEGISEFSENIRKKIIESPNSCSLHIRRGDYLFEKNAYFHGTCSLEYYQKAINNLNQQFADIKYFIFSDDIVWAKKNLKLENVFYVDDYIKRIPHEDIYLMSLCKHNIIANSSFSWWGAWLNQNSRKVVIAPKQWFLNVKMQAQSGDIIPQQWIRL